MSKWTVTLGALVAISALLGCEELLPPGFPHRAHLTEERCGRPGQPDCPTCASCHERVREDESDGPPSEAVCRSCHRDDTARVMSQVRLASHKRTDILFSHQLHLARPAIGGQCVGCHAGVADDGVKGGVYPPMKECLGCHQDGLEANACSSCHRRRELRSLVPETFLRHDVGFMKDHGLEASRHQATCNQCHAEAHCARCHDQSQTLGLAEAFPEEIERTLIHRADFVVRHAIEARSERGACVRCHSPSFCDSCHLERGVSGNRLGSANPHPIGWIGPDAGAASFHGRAARRDIVSCAGCHEAGPATNCIRCHKVGGPGGNPHPAGWSSFRAPDQPMCRYCHEP